MYITSTYLYQNYSKNQPKATIDEVISIVKNIRNSDLKKCNLILDIENGTVVKCRNFKLYDDTFANSLNGPDYQRVLDYFMGLYPEQISVLLDAIRTTKKLNASKETVTIGA